MNWDDEVAALTKALGHRPTILEFIVLAQAGAAQREWDDQVRRMREMVWGPE